jgi:hypothetical protein
MRTLIQSRIDVCEEEWLVEAEDAPSMLRVANKIMTEKAVFLRNEEKKKTKPSIFDNPQVLPRLAMAFCIGATVEEAAHFAGCSVSAIKKHMREQTPFHYTSRWGEDCTTTFEAMVNSWRCHVTMLAKMKICESLLDPKTGTKDAWKVLERREPEEWGRVCRACHRRR